MRTSGVMETGEEEEAKGAEKEEAKGGREGGGGEPNVETETR